MPPSVPAGRSLAVVAPLTTGSLAHCRADCAQTIRGLRGRLVLGRGPRHQLRLHLWMKSLFVVKPGEGDKNDDALNRRRPSYTRALEHWSIRALVLCALRHRRRPAGRRGKEDQQVLRVRLVPCALSLRPLRPAPYPFSLSLAPCPMPLRPRALRLAPRLFLYINRCKLYILDFT